MNDIEKAIEFYKAKSYEEGGIRDRYTRLAIEALEEKLSGGWIPASERLPEEYGDYLVAWRPINLTADDVMRLTGSASHWYEILEYDPDDEALWIGSIEQCDGAYEIIAWQELPEPYKEVEE